MSIRHPSRIHLPTRPQLISRWFVVAAQGHVRFLPEVIAAHQGKAAPAVRPGAPLANRARRLRRNPHRAAGKIHAAFSSSWARNTFSLPKSDRGVIVFAAPRDCVAPLRRAVPTARLGPGRDGRGPCRQGGRAGGAALAAYEVGARKVPVSTNDIFHQQCLKRWFHAWPIFSEAL